MIDVAIGLATIFADSDEFQRSKLIAVRIALEYPCLGRPILCGLFNNTTAIKLYLIQQCRGRTHPRPVGNADNGIFKEILVCKGVNIIAKIRVIVVDGKVAFRLSELGILAHVRSSVVGISSNICRLQLAGIVVCGIVTHGHGIRKSY